MCQKNSKVNVLFVCLGNICRSPTAHALFQAHVNQQGLSDYIFVDSAGTSDWNVGLPPDARSQDIARQYGYDMSHLQARQVSSSDFATFDYILAMDHENMANLKRIQPAHYKGVLGLFLEESGVADGASVPDPYYGDEQHFKQVIEHIEDAVNHLLLRIRKEYSL